MIRLTELGDETSALNLICITFWSDDKRSVLSSVLDKNAPLEDKSDKTKVSVWDRT